ncbi:MAG: hypothetical protein MZV64_24025 [Ignavibacteriales bacterium]|nr:hypothetical protein [Ignavibacteriales bacterium]
MILSAPVRRAGIDDQYSEHDHAARTDAGPRPHIRKTSLQTVANWSSTRAQDGDTMPALAARFNTTAAEILRSQPDHPARRDHHAARPADADPDLLPPTVGDRLIKRIPGSCAFVNGPAHVGFEHESAFVGIDERLVEETTAPYAGGKEPHRR